MNILIDTHTLVWYFINRKKIPDSILGELQDIDNIIWYSPISLYEMCQKYRLGKWGEVEHLIDGFLSYMKDADFAELPIAAEHARLAGKMKWNHRDPFDRILAAQAMSEEYRFATADKVFDDLPMLETIW